MFGFGKKDPTSGGAIADVIRCDETEYLVWKWRPGGAEANTTARENSIRWGSSLRVKDGEVAVFVYSQKDGGAQDFIVGPQDETLKTANFPILASIIGAGFGGGSPFQAEVYFINLAGNIQVRFAVPYFPVRDPRFMDFSVPIAVRGSFTFNITDYRGFIKLNRLVQFELDAFQKQVKDALTKYVKGYVTNAPRENGIPVLALEEKILELGDLIQPRIKAALEGDFGVNLKRFDLAHIEYDADSDGYRDLRKITAEQVTRTVQTQTDVNLRNMTDMQRIQSGNTEEQLRMQREAMERQQRLQTESQYLQAHQMNLQADVAKAAAEGMGNMGAGASMGGGMNPGAMMAGMAMGGAVGGAMAGQMQQFMGGFNQPQMPMQGMGGVQAMPGAMQNPMGSPMPMGPQGMPGPMPNPMSGMPGMATPAPNSMGGMPAIPIGGAISGMPPVPGMPPAPPPMPEVQYMVVVGGQHAGPFSASQLAAYVSAGQVTGHTMVWTQGMAQWAPVASVPALDSLFAGPPPTP